MQFLIVASALLGVAFGQLAGYPALPGYQGLEGYKGYPGYQGYPAGYPGYQGLNGYKGYGGAYGAYPGAYGAYPGAYGAYPGAYPGYTPFGVKPVDPKVKDVLVKPVVPVVPALPSAPILPVVPKTAYTGPYPSIRSQTQETAADGSYSWSYATENGIQAAESGAPRSIGPEGTEEVVVGEYAYTSPEGVPVHVRYTADGNGFHPEIVSTNYNGYYGTARSGLPLDAPVVPVVAAPVVAASVEKKESTPEKKEE